MLHPGGGGEPRQSQERRDSARRWRGSSPSARSRRIRCSILPAGRATRRWSPRPPGADPAGRGRPVERHLGDPQAPRCHHPEPARRRRLVAQPRLLRAAHLGAGAASSRRAVTEPQEREILLRCRAELRPPQDRRRACTPRRPWPTTSPTSWRPCSSKQVNLYGISYGTRWALEVLRRHPAVVRSAVLDAVYPPQINGEQNEPEIVRGVFEQLFAECAADKLCRERNPDLAGGVRRGADRRPSARRSSSCWPLEDGPQPVRLDGAKLLPGDAAHDAPG